VIFEGRLWHCAFGWVLALVVGFATLAASPSSASAAAPTVDANQTAVGPTEPLLDKPHKGTKAVNALGDDLAVAADRNDLRPAELRSLLRTDDAVWVDTEGLIFYVDPAPETVATDDGPTPVSAAPLAETFALHSNPGANLTILLDFDGATVSGTAWNIDSGVTPGTHPAWDPAGNGPAFNDGERLKIQQVWAMVAEDYAPFNVDVTTQDSGADRIIRSSSADNTYGTRVLISPSDDPFAKICSRECGGVAYLDTFGEVGSYAQPAWVFPQALDDAAKNVAEAAAHEAGHNLNLNHDGFSTQDYYAGHGIWAPVMGVGYDRPLVQWSSGAYTGASDQQDDVAILTGLLGARPDEASDSVATPSALPDGPRIVGTRSDVDAYLLGACTVGSSVTVSPAAVAPDLDVRAVLYDGSGVQQSVSQPTSTSGDGTTAGGLGASVTIPDGSGGWVLTVEGVGQGAWGSAGYDDYGSLGAYTVDAPGCDGEVVEGAPSEPVDVVTSTSGQDRATLSWSAPVSAPGGPVTGYVVTRSGSTASQGLGADVRSHTFTGLVPSTAYQLSVRAVNAVGAGPSVTVSSTTTAPPPPANDDVADAQRLTGPVGSVSGDNTHATENASDPQPPEPSAGGYSVWYSWTPTSNGVVTFVTTGGGADRDTTLAVYTGGPGSLAQVAANDDRGDELHAGVSFAAQAGVRYLLVVDGFGWEDGSGPFTLAWDQKAPEVRATAPAAPGSVTASRGDGSSVVSWAVPNDNGSPITGYTVRAGARVFTTSGAATSLTVSGLANGRLYRFTVSASNVAGESTASGEATVTPSGPPGASGRPKAKATRGKVKISWKAPSANGAAITSYTLRRSDGVTRTVKGGASSYTWKGLKKGKKYSFRIYAVNQSGAGKVSSPSRKVTVA